MPGEALQEVGVGLPTYAWVLPGLLAALLCVAAATPWLRSLPLPVRRRVLLAVCAFGAPPQAAPAHPVPEDAHVSR